MRRARGQIFSVQAPRQAAGRLREIELEIREILSTYPDLSFRMCNGHAGMAQPSRGQGALRIWRRRIPGLK
jgi:hypothetical protein